MKENKNNFICIGAVHSDYTLKLKSKFYKNRTNPIIQTKSLGGVAYNIAEKLSFLNIKSKLFSLNSKKKNIDKIKKNKIDFIPLNKKIYSRSYSTILNSKGQMILGMANMDNYEKLINLNKSLHFKKKNIILDLNLSKEIIKSLILKNYNLNKICICGTSGHKIYKIRKLLRNIDILIMNKQESLNLTKKKDILKAMKLLIKINNNLTIVITNGKNTVYAYKDKIIYSCKPPKIIVKNENKAGDVMSAFFYFFYFNSIEFSNVLKKSIIAGALYTNGYNENKNNFINKINILSKSININSKKYYE